MSVIGYVRLSKGERGSLGLADQRAKILAAYPDSDVREEIKSGEKAANRTVLAEIRALLRRGDTLVVAKLDRLSRSLLDFATIVAEAQKRGWTLVVLDQGFDLATPHGEAMAGMLAVFAQFERRMIGQRTREALAAKRATGWDPRKHTPAFRRRVLRLRARGLTQRAIAAEMKTHKETIARVLRAA